MAKLLLYEYCSQSAKRIVTLLSSQGHEVHTTHSGIELMERLKNREFDLLITELFMPDMEGLEITLNANRMRPDLRILAKATSHEFCSHYYLKVATDFGANETLMSPYSDSSLINKVKLALEKKHDNCHSHAPME